MESRRSDVEEQFGVVLDKILAHGDGIEDLAPMRDMGIAPRIASVVRQYLWDTDDPRLEREHPEPEIVVHGGGRTLGKSSHGINKVPADEYAVDGPKVMLDKLANDSPGHQNRRHFGMGICRGNPNVLPAAVGDVRVFRDQCRMHEAQRIGMPGVVGIEKSDVIAMGMGECQIARGVRTGAILVGQRDMFRVCVNQTLQDIG